MCFKEAWFRTLFYANFLQLFRSYSPKIEGPDTAIDAAHGFKGQQSRYLFKAQKRLHVSRNWEAIFLESAAGKPEMSFL